jgi:hypothetical protein
MAVFRLYRKIYVINYSIGNTNYTLINPFSISANTYISNVLVESNLNVVQESTGVYYVDLNPSLYNNQNVYELRWFIKYVNNSTEKILQTLFMYESTSPDQLYVFGEIGYELENNSVEFEIKEQSEIIIEIINNQ